MHLGIRHLNDVAAGWEDGAALNLAAGFHVAMPGKEMVSLDVPEQQVDNDCSEKE
jgi:hypothetical protein